MRVLRQPAPTSRDAASGPPFRCWRVARSGQRWSSGELWVAVAVVVLVCGRGVDEFLVEEPSDGPEPRAGVAQGLPGARSARDAGKPRS